MSLEANGIWSNSVAFVQAHAGHALRSTNCIIGVFALGAVTIEELLSRFLNTFPKPLKPQVGLIGTQNIFQIVEHVLFFAEVPDRSAKLAKLVMRDRQDNGVIGARLRLRD